MRPIIGKSFCYLTLCLSAPLPAQTLEPQNSNTAAEFRGLSAVTGEVVWASGRGGWFSVTSDGGTNWRADTIPGASGLFLVDIEALSANDAYVLGTDFNGGLARIYRTRDGGHTWETQYEIIHPQAFLDGFAFFDDTTGIAFGDPVDGTFFILRTTDGKRWSRVTAGRIPRPLDGEAGFAASGTAIATDGVSTAWIGTGGGQHARVLVTTDRGVTWRAIDTPLPAGSTAGIFGVAFRDPKNGVAVGGDYGKPRDGAANVLVTHDAGIHWEVQGSSTPAGVRYGAVFGDSILLAAGPSGLGFSRTMGTGWTPLDTAGYNTVAMLPNGTGWAAGTGGRIVRIRFAPAD